MDDIVFDGLTLPADMVWVDEYSWSPVSAQEDVSLAGTTILQASKRLSGRRFELRSQDNCAWVKRAILDQLKIRRDDEALTPMVLTLADGRTFNVVFDHSKECLESDPIQPGKDTDPDNEYRVVIRLMGV